MTCHAAAWAWTLGVAVGIGGVSPWPAMGAPAPVSAIPSRATANQHFELGQSYYLKGDLDTAIAEYSLAIALDPTHIAAYAARGRALGMLAAYDRAIADYTAAIALDPDLAAAYGSRGIAHIHNGDTDAALDDLWHAAQLYRAQDADGGYFHTLDIIRRLAP